MKYTPISSWWLLNEDFENGHWDFYVIRTYTCTPFEFCLATFFNKLAVKETLLLVYMILTDKHVCSVSDCLYREYTDSVHCDLFVVCQAIPADEWYLISKLSFSVFFFICRRSFSCDDIMKCMLLQWFFVIFPQLFSPCSKRRIVNVLKSKSDCFRGICVNPF